MLGSFVMKCFVWRLHLSALFQGNFTQAKLYYAEAVQLEPRNPLLKKNIEKLNQAMLRNELLGGNGRFTQP